MSKRFGRNQKRKLREELASADRVLRAASRSYHELFHEYEALKRKAIVIDVDVLRDNSRMHYEAMIEAHKMGYEGLYVAQRLDERDIAMRRERDGFIEHVARAMASQIARAIGQRW